MTKKKLIITITSLCLVVVAAVAAVVGILAATNVTISSSLTVTYTPKPEVIATVNGVYFRAGDKTVTKINETPYGNGYLTGESSYTLPNKELTVEDGKQYVIFAFSFKNDAVTENENSVILHVQENGIPTTGTNMEITVKKVVYKTTTTTESDPKPVDLTDAGAVAAIKGLTDAPKGVKNIQIGETGYVYVLVELHEQGKTASWQATGISFALSAGKTELA